MKNILIVYKSETKFTERYAKWLSDKLSCDISNLQDLSKDQVDNYDVLIYGGGLYAGKINGFDHFKNTVPSDKKLVLFVTGATPASETDTIQKFFDDNLSEQEQKNIPHFYAVSGLDYEHMSFKHKMMMKGLLFVLKRKESDMYNDIHQSFDACDFSYLDALVDCVKAM
ncbi:flavodoxin domain-containing protein [Intestinibacter sp.]